MGTRLGGAAEIGCRRAATAAIIFQPRRDTGGGWTAIFRRGGAEDGTSVWRHLLMAAQGAVKQAICRWRGRQDQPGSAGVSRGAWAALGRISQLPAASERFSKLPDADRTALLDLLPLPTVTCHHATARHLSLVITSHTTCLYDHLTSNNIAMHNSISIHDKNIFQEIRSTED